MNTITLYAQNIYVFFFFKRTVHKLNTARQNIIYLISYGKILLHNVLPELLILKTHVIELCPLTTKFS